MLSTVPRPCQARNRHDVIRIPVNFLAWALRDAFSDKSGCAATGKLVLKFKPWRMPVCRRGLVRKRNEPVGLRFEKN